MGRAWAGSDRTGLLGVIDRIQLRRLSKLRYFDPVPVLTAIRKLEPEVAASPTPVKIKTLRTNGLKRLRENLDAAIFAVGMAAVLGKRVLVSPEEADDFDFVTAWVDKREMTFCRVQLKEVVNEEINPNADIQTSIDQLCRYDLSGIAVAMKINRSVHFDPKAITVPKELRIGSLWIFGCITLDKSEYGIWGDFVQGAANVIGRRFPHPQ